MSTRAGLPSSAHSEGGMIAMLAADAREEDRLARADGDERHERRRPHPRAAAARARSDEAAGSREGAEEWRCRSRFKPPSSAAPAGTSLPEDVRKQADTPWFRSLLLSDPGGGDAETQAADPHHPGRPRCAGRSRTTPKSLASWRARARRTRDRSKSCTSPASTTSSCPPTTGDGPGVSGAETESDQPGGRHDHRRLAEEVAAVSGID